MMKKIILAFLSLAVLLSVFTLTATAAEVEDKSNVIVGCPSQFESADIEAINQTAKLAEVETEVHFLIAIYDSFEIVSDGEETVRKFGLDIEKDDIVLLIVEVGVNVYYEMFTYGKPNTMISDSEVNDILDSESVYNEIKYGDITSGIISFIEQSKDAINSYRRGAKVIMIIIPFVAGAIAVIAVIASYKKKLKSPIYPLSKYAKMELTEHTDIFLGKSVTRTRISSSSSGSGGGGGSSGGSRGRR